MVTSRARTVVIVHREDTQRSRMQSILGQAGFTVHACSTAREGLRRLSRPGRIDLVITGIAPPGIDGWALCRLLRLPEYRAFNDTPVLAVSDDPDAGEARRISLESGADEFMSLPFDGSDFLDTVRRLLAGRKRSASLSLLLAGMRKEDAVRISRYFADRGFAVRMPGTASEALKVSKTLPPDLAVIHDTARGATAMKLARAVRKARRDSVIIVTSRRPLEAAAALVSAGVYAILRAPVSPEDLHSAWRNALAERSFLGTRKAADGGPPNRSERRFQLLLENVTDAVFVLDEAGRFVYASPGIERMSGYSVKEVEGRNFIDFVHPDDLPGLVESYGRTLGGELEPYEFRVFDRDGSVHFVHTSSRTLPGNGGPAGLVVVMSDVTERKRMDDAITRAKQDWEATFDAVPDFIMILDKDQTVLRSNRAMAGQLGLAPADMVGKKCYELVHEGGTLPQACPHRMLLQDGRMHTEEIYEERFDRWFLVSTSPLHDTRGGVRGAVHVMRDITARRRMEEALRTSLKEKEVLIKEVHHRVKNNFQIIMSLLNIQSRHTDDERVRAAFTGSENRMRAMALVHERLYRSEDLSRIDFASYVTAMVRDIGLAHAREGRPVALAIEADEVSLSIEQAVPAGLILNELLTNAFKYAFPRPAPADRISVGLHGTGEGMVEMSVGDNGVGIPEGVGPDAASTLGISLVYILTSQLGGELRLERDGGTRYTLSFKLR